MMFMRDSICMIFKLPHNHKSMLCHFRYEMNHLFSQKNYPHVQHLDTLILYLGLASENELLPNRLKAQPPCFVIWDFEDWSWWDPSKELKFPKPIPTTQKFWPCKCKGCPSWKRVFVFWNTTCIIQLNGRTCILVPSNVCMFLGISLVKLYFIGGKLGRLIAYSPFRL